jgi:mono/diheme cytochrome c family protein
MAMNWLALWIALVVASFLLPTDAFASEQLFKTRCAGCHARAATLARSLPGGDAEQARAHLDTFLASHYATDEAERRSITAYLLSLRK